MTFTDHTMLVALVALAIPLAIHLLGRRRARVVVLPTARLAEGAHAASRGRVWMRRIALLGLRLAVIALLVLALAGPQLAPGDQHPSQSAPGEHKSTQLAPGEHTGGQIGEIAPPAAPPPVYSRGANYDATAPRPIRVLIVDAAGEKGARVRTADLLAATFAGDAAVPKQVSRRAAADLKPEDAAAADVVFLAGDPKKVPGTFFACPVVCVPAAPDEKKVPDTFFAPDEVPAGVTIDPEGYQGDLVAAFEGGTSGDIGAPVFRRRLILKEPDAGPSGGIAQVIRFTDGRPAIIDSRTPAGRTVTLAFGPAPYWGDLASRAEFVVLTHSLAEGLAPQAQPAPGEHKSTQLAPGEYTGGCPLFQRHVGCGEPPRK